MGPYLVRPCLGAVESLALILRWYGAYVRTLHSESILRHMALILES